MSAHSCCGFLCWGGRRLGTEGRKPSGRDLFSVMYVSPRSISRIMDNKPVTNVAIQNAAVQILKGGQVVAEKSMKGTGQWWTQGQSLTGLLINKNETPFAPLYWDRYEAIKPAAR